MIELMKLEIKKFKLTRYIKIVLLITAGTMLFITFPILGEASGDKFTYPNAFSMIGLVINSAFMVFSAILMSTLVISEYNNKTILVMFTYPIDRYKIMRAKLLLLCLITIAGLTFGYFCTIAHVMILDRFFDVIQGQFYGKALADFVVEIILRIIMSSILCLIPFIAGMWRQSVPTTIVSTRIVVFVMQLVVSESPGTKEMIISAVLLMAAVLMMVRVTFRTKLNNLDTL